MAYSCQFRHLYFPLYDSHEFDQHRIINSIQRYAVPEFNSTYGDVHHLHQLCRQFSPASRTATLCEMEPWTVWYAGQHCSTCVQCLGMFLVILAQRLSREPCEHELGCSFIRWSSCPQCHIVCHTREEGIRGTGGQGKDGLLR